MMNVDPTPRTKAKALVSARLQATNRLPSIPAILSPLLQQLQLPPDDQDMNAVIHLISQDNSIAAQCLHMANSPLFGRVKAIETVRAAVISLGVRRMQDIAMSCCLLKLSPTPGCPIDAKVFWEHSFACALLCQRFAHAIGYKNPEAAYMAGLLHDIGIIVNLWMLPEEFRAALEMARANHIPLHEAETSVLGLTHEESGALLAERWKFGPEMMQVISFHHRLEAARSHRALVAIVTLNDLMCRMRRLGYGYEEECLIDFLEHPAFAILLSEFPKLQNFDWARFTFELESHVEEVQQLVSLVYKAGK
jgi:putative nucleotidyltransferase with HDIG domain